MTVSQADPAYEHQQIDARDDAGEILRLILNPDINQERLAFLISTRDQMLARQAMLAYAHARAEMAVEMPIIEKKGRMDRGSGKAIDYGKWEDVNEKIAPVMQRHGFFLEFKTDSKSMPGRIEVTCYLRHANGHLEQTSLDSAPDTSGGKNAIQAQISTVTYLKRHTAGALLNLSYRGEDDDGASANRNGNGAALTDEQIKTLEDKIEEVGADRALFCDLYGIEQVGQLSGGKYAEAMAKLTAFKKQEDAKAAAGKPTRRRAK